MYVEFINVTSSTGLIPVIDMLTHATQKTIPHLPIKQTTTYLPIKSDLRNSGW